MAEGTRALDGFVLLFRMFPLHVLLLRPCFAGLILFAAPTLSSVNSFLPQMPYLAPENIDPGLHWRG